MCQWSLLPQWQGIPTGKAVPKLRVRLKVLAVRDHGRAKVAARKLLLTVVALCAFRQRLDVCRHSPLHLVHAYDSVSMYTVNCCHIAECAYRHDAGSSLVPGP